MQIPLQWQTTGDSRLVMWIRNTRRELLEVTDTHSGWLAVMVSQDCVHVKPHGIPLDMCRAGVVAQWQSLCEDLGLQNRVQATVCPYSLAGGMGPTKKDREESL